MPAFKVVQQADRAQPFSVVGPDGSAASDIDEFLAHLCAQGRSGYTQRSYALGLAHFFAWLHRQDIPISAVTTQVIGRYVEDYRTGVKGGACPVAGQRAGQINVLTRKPAPALERQPRTINHRLSVLASFFAYRDACALDAGMPPCANPVPVSTDPMAGGHGLRGRDAPVRGRRGLFRRRVSRTLPKDLEPQLIERLIDAATSWRDKAILTLLYRTGQRIGDWSSYGGRHGVLGMGLADFDERRSRITVRLKGARDEHCVPVTADFWPLFHRYLAHERPPDGQTAAWVAFRKGRGKPLTYAAFESSLRYAGRKLGANVNAHMLRHTLAQAIVETGEIKVAQDLLGHSHIGTTLDVYAHADQRALVEAVAAAKRRFDMADHDTTAPVIEGNEAVLTRPRYVFAYDQATVDELEGAAIHTPQPPPAHR